MIGDTASISLLTGNPGSGKSLRLAEAITTLVEKGDHVYVSNIDGLKIKGVTPWPDPKEWRELPAGSILFVDEAQEFFPARVSGAPPSEVIMNKIRHEGIRLVLATQQPNYLHSYLRGLVGRHEHLLRRDGRQESFLFADNQVMENVRQKLSVIKRSYDYSVYKFNPKYFACYDSAQTHTVKFQMPALMKKALIIIPIVAVMLGVAWGSVFRDGYTMSKAGDAAPGTAKLAGVSPTGAAPGVAGATPGDGKAKRITTADYLAQLVPRISYQPWSAPVFDSTNVQPKSKPELYCMSSSAGTDAQGKHQPETCGCMTEQGTRYQLDQQTCYALINEGGTYNPYRDPEQGASNQNDAEQQKSDAPAGGEQRPPPVGMKSEDGVTPYGLMRGKQYPVLTLNQGM